MRIWYNMLHLCNKVDNRKNFPFVTNKKTSTVKKLCITAEGRTIRPSVKLTRIGFLLAKNSVFMLKQD